MSPDTTVKEISAMPRKLRAHLSYANVMATIAVFVALGGTSYAALRVTGANVPKDALTGADIKNLTGKDIRNGTVRSADVKGLTSADVADGKLRAKDFAPGQLPQGEPGTALAFARVVNDGTVDAGRSKGIAAANVTNPSAGLYCFDGLGFTPKNVVATPETAPRIVNAFAIASDSPSCPGDEDFLVTTRDPDGTLQSDTPFFVAVN
jgi:hypothetical protein